MPETARDHRLWRVRRRHDHIDATLHSTRAGWTLRFFRNDRLLLAWRFSSESAARADAVARRRELERAGWVSHW
jgi:hypothetical protein